ncbi:hypothetical protein WA158_006729 [Blastocystis sp. Blastoise]
MSNVMKSYHMKNYFTREIDNPRLFISPSKYIQGPNVLSNIGKYIVGISPFNEKRSVIVVSSAGGLKRFQERIQKSFEENKIECEFFTFNGQCSQVGIDSICEVVHKKSGVDFMIALGGGKAIDTTRAVGTLCNIPVIVVPTLASNDSPTASLSVVYQENGERDYALFNYVNPALIIMDSEVIVNTPARYLAAGIGDAYSTYIEARTCFESDTGINSTRCRPTLAAKAIAKSCTETLLNDSMTALQDLENKKVTVALENIIEANTLLSGLGFENGGLGAAHAIGTGLTALEGIDSNYLHGELVALDEELAQTLEFFTKVGLPIVWSQLKLDINNDQTVSVVANYALTKFWGMMNMQIPKELDFVMKGIRRGNTIAQEYFEKNGCEQWNKHHHL